MNKEAFQAILMELIDENPFAIRAVLKILSVEFTSSVPTLAVTKEERPRLLVNLDFISENCATDAHVKAVICHEFLHVLLRHTEGKLLYSYARHVAEDSVINAIIHRTMGDQYSSMMGSYYRDVTGLMKLLRPMNSNESAEMEKLRESGECPLKMEAWNGLYEGKLVADDIEMIAKDVMRLEGTFLRVILIGNHDNFGMPLPKAIKDALERAMRTMNGSGIWRSPKSRGVGAMAYDTVVSGENRALGKWKRTTLAILKKHLLPDLRSPAGTPMPFTYKIPVISPGDRRAFIRTLWDEFIPEASWNTFRTKPEGRANVYLDVSGSMNAEMPVIIALLNQLRRHIKMPFWAFSDKVAPAVIENFQLKTQTTGGTSMKCVLVHLAATRPDSAVVFTDGYIEKLEPADVKKTTGIKFHVILSRDGSPDILKKAGIPYIQLDRIPA